MCQVLTALSLVSPSEVPTLVPCLPTVPKTKEFIPFVNLMILEARKSRLNSSINYQR